VDCVIQLPSNLFFGVSIATCIIVLKKSKKDNKVLFIDATDEFVHSGNKNKLDDDNIEKILSAYIERTDKEHFAKLVENEKIGENDYNISVSSYVEQKDTREVVNIQELNASLVEIVAKQDALRKQIDKIVADLEGVA
jgi:type I restriction enzyme M protein